MVGCVICQAAGEEVAPREVVRRANLDVKGGDAPFPRSAENLHAGVEWNNVSFDETDRARVERYEVLAEVEAEVELVGAFQEERAFLGKEQRELRQIDLPRVDFGLGKIGVDGDHASELRGHVVADIDAGPTRERPIGRDEVPGPLRERVRVDREAGACTESRYLERAGAAEIRQTRVERRPAPSQRLPLSRNIPFSIESPRAELRVESNGIHGDCDLCGPACCRPGHPRVPHAVPIERNIVGIGDESIVARAGSVHSEVIAAALIAEGIENDGHRVIAVHVAISLHGVDGDPVRLRVSARKSEIEVAAVADDANCRRVRRHRTRMRTLLRETECLSPCRFIETAVNANACAIDADHVDGLLLGET